MIKTTEKQEEMAEMEGQKPSEIIKDRRIEGIVYAKTAENKWVIAMGVRQVSAKKFKRLLYAKLYLRWRWRTISIVIMAAVATMTADWARYMQEIEKTDQKD